MTRTHFLQRCLIISGNNSWISSTYQEQVHKDLDSKHILEMKIISILCSLIVVAKEYGSQKLTIIVRTKERVSMRLEWSGKPSSFPMYMAKIQQERTIETVVRSNPLGSGPHTSLPWKKNTCTPSKNLSTNHITLRKKFHDRAKPMIDKVYVHCSLPKLGKPLFCPNRWPSHNVLATDPQ